MIIIIFPQMAQRSLPAVLLLLLGFVEAVDIKGNKIVTVITIFLVVFVIKLSSSLSSSPSFTLVLLVEAKAHFLSVWISFLLRPRISFSKCNEFLLQIPPPSQFFAISFFGPFVSAARRDASRLQRMRSPISSNPSSASLFRPKPFSLIPTATDIQPENFAPNFNLPPPVLPVQCPVQKSNSCDGTK